MLSYELTSLLPTSNINLTRLGSNSLSNRRTLCAVVAVRAVVSKLEMGTHESLSEREAAERVIHQ